MSDEYISSQELPSAFRMVDLFAGCGGLTAGFVSTGNFKPVAAVEKELFPAATYAANFGGDHVFQGDIAAWVQGDLPEADIIIGGPPCQGFSSLGKQDPKDPRNALWDSYVEALWKIQPKAFLIENVSNFLDSTEFVSLKAEMQPGRRLENYVLYEAVVNAAEYGAAQIRKRAIVIGTHRDLDPIEVPLGKFQNRREEWRTVHAAIGGLRPQRVRRLELPDRHDYSRLLNLVPDELKIVENIHRVPGVFQWLDIHVTRFYEEKSRQRFRKIKAGENWKALPDHMKAPCWIGHTGSGDVMGRLRWDKPSVTIRTEFHKPEKGRYLHPSENRALTPLEGALLQGFPEDFKWCGTKPRIIRQIGNAVPVELAQALALHINAELRKQL